jgi:phage baseplate assembly protein W
MAFNLSYDITVQSQQISGTIGPINWSPTMGSAAEIIQNVRMILLTPIFSQVFDRKLGVNMNFLDLPQNLGMALMRFSISMAIQVFEPRFVIDSITFGDQYSAAYGTIVANIDGHLDTSVLPIASTSAILGSGTSTWMCEVINGVPVVDTEIVSS